MKVAVIGASGYVGAELIALLCAHDKISLTQLVVSEHSSSAHKSFAELHAKYLGLCDLPLIPFSSAWLQTCAGKLDAVFFATPHEFSAQWAAAFLEMGIKVFDLSGGFRLKNPQDYADYYHFDHHNSELLTQAVYGLAEWHTDSIAQAKLIAVPGCYPTASLLSLKPVTSNHLHLEDGLIVINGISGVSGAGRTASLATSFNEVSLTPYNILQHRHQPEISQQAKAQVIFNPHLAPYKRGLLTTTTLQLKEAVTDGQLEEAFQQAYQDKPLVRLVDTWPKIDNVAHGPFADIHWQYDSAKRVVVISCAIDNLLKGAAAQAVQCANISLALPSQYGLLPTATRGSC